MLRILDRIAEAIAIISFAVSSAFVFINVLNRYLVLTLLRDWAKDHESFRPTYFAIRDAIGSIVVTADEVPGLLLVWVAFLGAYIAMRKEGHISFDLVVESLPRVGRLIARGLNTALIAGFLMLVFWWLVYIAWTAPDDPRIRRHPDRDGGDRTRLVHAHPAACLDPADHRRRQPVPGPQGPRLTWLGSSLRCCWR